MKALLAATELTELMMNQQIFHLGTMSCVKCCEIVMRHSIQINSNGLFIIYKNQLTKCFFLNIFF